MDYATASELARIFSLFLFFALFVGVAVWVFRPSARARFEAQARIPLEEGSNRDE